MKQDIHTQYPEPENLTVLVSVPSSFRVSFNYSTYSFLLTAISRIYVTRKETEIKKNKEKKRKDRTAGDKKKNRVQRSSTCSDVFVRYPTMGKEFGIRS